MIMAASCGDDDTPPPPPSGDGGRDGGGDGSVITGCVTAMTIEGATSTGAAPDGIAGNGDLAVQNDVVRAVFAAVDRPAQLGASGGTLVDLHLLGKSDHFNELSQLGGPAQELQVYYDEMTIAEQTGDHAIVEMTGYIRPQPGARLTPEQGSALHVTTRYEMKCGEPIVHIDSTLTNTSAMAINHGPSLAPMDIILWGGRSMLPFCPVVGQGDHCRPFDIMNPLAGLVESLYVGASGSLTGDPGTFSYYLEDPDITTLIGVHGTQVSSLGFFYALASDLAAGASVRYRRAIAVGNHADAASGTDIALAGLEAQGLVELGTVTGTVTPPAGETFSADEYERPTVLLATPPAAGSATDPMTWTPITMARVDATGAFSARVPVGRISYELRARARAPKRGDGGMVAAGATLAIPAIALDEAPVLDVHVREGDVGLPARVIVVGADTTPTPELGGEAGGSPSLNTAQTDGDGDVSLLVPPGTYDVYATRGIEYSIARQRVTVTTTGAETTLAIQAVPVIPEGFLTADFHVHSAASFDSSLPPTDRVMAYLVENVDALVSTEHDVIFDLAPALAALEAELPPVWQGQVKTFVGLESTNFVPQPDYPHTFGHNNVFPLVAQPGAHKNGAPNDEWINPGTLYELLRALPGPAGTPLVQFNHPRAGREGTVWLGFFDACGFDPTLPFGELTACFSATGPMGTHAYDFDVMEVLNGKNIEGFVATQRDWLSFLRQAPGGRLPVATSNSDSHRLVVDQAGFPVTVLQTATPLAMLDDAALKSAVESGSMSGSLGPFVWFTATETGGSATPVGPGRAMLSAPSGNVTLNVRVTAAPWVPVDEIRIRVGGVVVQRITAPAITSPSDPFGTDGVVRYDGPVTLPGTLTADSFITIEAGIHIPRVGDLDGDGRIDATDNDGDGDVDMDDMAGGIDFGAVPMPYGIVSTEGRPLGYTNAVFVDVDGDGMYDPIGTPLTD